MHTTLFDARMTDALRSPPSIFMATRGPPSLRPLKDGSGYALTVAAPGVRAKDLSVSVKDGVLSINGETKSADYTHVVKWATRVPRDADVENGTAAVTCPRAYVCRPIYRVLVRMVYLHLLSLPLCKGRVTPRVTPL